MKKTLTMFLTLVVITAVTAQVPTTPDVPDVPDAPDTSSVTGDAQVSGINATLAKLRVDFSHDSASLPQAESTEMLIRTIADTINKITSQIPQGYSLYVIGHASAPGTDDYNMALGRQRAKEVKSRLNMAGVANNVLKIKSMGESQNQRAVTFKVLKD